MIHKRMPCFLYAALLMLACAARAAEIRHRFVATDESGHQVIHVDETNPAANWAVPVSARDMQLVGGNRVMVSVDKGFEEYDLATGKLLRSVGVPAVKRVMSARRMPDGTTYVAGYGAEHPVVIAVVDEAGETVETIRCEAPVANTRAMRVTAANTFLLGDWATLYELDRSGKILRRLVAEIPGKIYVYKGVRLPDGGTWIAGGYAPAMALLDAEGKTVRVFGKPDAERPKSPFFFSDFQLLEDGGIVVCNWLGHAREDSRKGDQIVQYDRDGNPVWTWHDPDFAGSIHGIIVLDNLDTERLHTERDGMLKPVAVEGPR